MQQKTIRFLGLFILSASLLASGCGFHLRGKIDVPDNLRRMHLLGDDLALKDRLGDGLEFSDIEILDSADGVAQLDMRNSQYVKEVNGTSDSGTANSYKLSYAVTYEVFDPEQKSLQKHHVTQTRTLAFDPANVLLFEREESFLIEDMQKELVTQMLRRISKIK